MRTLIPADAVASRLIGEQKAAPDAALRKSRFCVSLACEEGTLLYHTLTGELRLLTGGETPEGCSRELAEAWYFVPEDFDEVRRARQIQTILAAAAPRGKEKTAFVILPTTGCNARCAYCFERGVKPLFMSRETAKDVGEYIARSCGGKPVSIHWFGGEPLYNRPAIDTICEAMREHRVEYTSHMTSNGYYLDAETAGKAVRDWHMKHVQITLDGTEKVYNRIKAYREEDENPFRRVIQNIDAALDAGLRVYVRLNMDAENADDLFCLADELGERFRGRKGLSSVVVLLKEFTGKIRKFSTDEEAMERRSALMEKLEGYGFGLEILPLNGKLIANRCNADNDAGEVILPDGGVTKCEHINCSGRIGSIYSEERDEQEIRAWKEKAWFPECEECVLLPRCGALKRCEWVKDGCRKTSRILKTQILEDQIREAYKTAKRKEDHCETEGRMGDD